MKLFTKWERNSSNLKHAKSKILEDRRHMKKTFNPSDFQI